MPKEMPGGLPEKKPIVETGEKRNLFKDFEGTVKAMAEIEGQGWLNEQANADQRSTAAYIAKYMKDVPLGSSFSMDINGGGGDHRWHVYSDGRVMFDMHFARRIADKEGLIKKLKSLGFEVRE